MMNSSCSPLWWDIAFFTLSPLCSLEEIGRELSPLSLREQEREREIFNLVRHIESLPFHSSYFPLPRRGEIWESQGTVHSHLPGVSEKRDDELFILRSLGDNAFFTLSHPCGLAEFDRELSASLWEREREREREREIHYSLFTLHLHLLEWVSKLDNTTWW